MCQFWELGPHHTSTDIVEWNDVRLTALQYYIGQQVPAAGNEQSRHHPP